MPCCLAACFSSVELLFSLVPAATVSTNCSSFVLLSSMQFTVMIPVFDGIACVNCVIYFKSRNVFNEWLRKLIVLCCLLFVVVRAGSWRLIDVCGGVERVL